MKHVSERKGKAKKVYSKGVFGKTFHWRVKCSKCGRSFDTKSPHATTCGKC